ncbi:UDP-glucose 4-epimerase [Heterostelium album PN500]|uniref:UDP-glucose 4-epimerase n=1 Tax=Heterostelium pallidum (strain ATCC 26659 / Pp 5 / PN500) TaxID=670386 RepID=D3BE81_HETP5|nr:UDP-glucose 4-epimerase [Heterostelium album PN500]EFA80212.1 UDP-glucose 4-epimerase [Heterostelium album PN500]|eukprot:XP_020432332.1 UDP-glucose 4-epimerase [Heterostelium album PN500]
MEPITDENIVLVTGGAGYIGSHTVVEMVEAGFTPLIIDNLSNSSVEAVRRVEEITGKKIEFHEMDILDEPAMDRLFSTRSIKRVIHFAGLKAVGESTSVPLKYYDNNITGTVNLLKVMARHHCKQIVFSSSATVYGDAVAPIREDSPLGATNPYGRTKLYIEGILEDLCSSDPEWNCVLLRYFNPVGAHPSGMIGEDPRDIPNNLMPYITQTAIGKRAQLSVFGNDYNTPDGTGVRDYIHVVDLAKGHISALRYLTENNRLGCVAFNLGTGRGYSVLEMIAAVEKASGVKVNYKIVERRKGDVATSFADPAKALSILGWKANYNQEDMCEHAWRWQSKNPNGYLPVTESEVIRTDIPMTHA